MTDVVWYILEDGSVADPADVAVDKSGILTHKDGRGVSYKPSGPRARMVSADEIAAYRKRDLKDEEPEEDVKLDKRTREYRNRAMKSE